VEKKSKSGEKIQKCRKNPKVEKKAKSGEKSQKWRKNPKLGFVFFVNYFAGLSGQQ